MSTRRKQNLGSEGFKAVAPATPIDYSNETVQALGVCVSDRAVKVFEYLLIPVLHCGSQRFKRTLNGRRKVILPFRVKILRLRYAHRFIELKETFFGSVRFTQGRIVSCPRFKRQSVKVLEVVVPLQKQKPVMHQPSTLFGSEVSPNTLSDNLKSCVSHSQYMELVNHYERLRHCGIHSIFVRLPHIHRNAFNIMPIRKSHHVIDNQRFVSVRQQINHGAVFNIGNNASWLLDDVDFVNAHPFRSFKENRTLNTGDILFENQSHKPLRDTYLIGNTGEGLGDRLLSNPFMEPIGHPLPFGIIRQSFGDGFTAVPTTEPASLDIDTNTLAMHRKVCNQYLLPSATNNVFRTTSKAGLGRINRFSVDVIVVVSLFLRDNMVAGKIKNVGHGSSTKNGMNAAAINSTHATSSKIICSFCCRISFLSIRLGLRHSSYVGGIKPILQPPWKLHFSGVVISKPAFTFTIAPYLPLSTMQSMSLVFNQLDVHNIRARVCLAMSVTVVDTIKCLVKLAEFVSHKNPCLRQALYTSKIAASMFSSSPPFSPPMPNSSHVCQPVEWNTDAMDCFFPLPTGYKSIRSGLIRVSSHLATGSSGSILSLTKKLSSKFMPAASSCNIRSVMYGCIVSLLCYSKAKMILPSAVTTRTMSLYMGSTHPLAYVLITTSKFTSPYSFNSLVRSLDFTVISLFFNNATDEFVNILLSRWKSWVGTITTLIVTNNKTAPDNILLNFKTFVRKFCFHDIPLRC